MCLDVLEEIFGGKCCEILKVENVEILVKCSKMLVKC